MVLRTPPRNPGYDLGTDGPPAAARLADAFAELALVISHLPERIGHLARASGNATVPP
jgi:hypothetical protein